MKLKKLTPQAKWNNKHPKCLKESSRRYYRKNRKKILAKLKVKYARKKKRHTLSLAK